MRHRTVIPLPALVLWASAAMAQTSGDAASLEADIGALRAALAALDPLQSETAATLALRQSDETFYRAQLETVIAAIADLQTRQDTLDRAEELIRLDISAAEARLRALPGHSAAPPPVARERSLLHLTTAERRRLASVLARCWTVEPGTLAAQTVVAVAFQLDAQGRLVDDAIDLLSSDGPMPAPAFVAARRAIKSCLSLGFDPGPTPTDSVRMVEMTFDPSQMRIR